MGGPNQQQRLTSRPHNFFPTSPQSPTLPTQQIPNLPPWSRRRGADPLLPDQIAAATVGSEERPSWTAPPAAAAGSWKGRGGGRDGGIRLCCLRARSRGMSARVARWCSLTRTEAESLRWPELGARAETQVACGRRQRRRGGGLEWMCAREGSVGRRGRGGDCFLADGEDFGGGGVELAWWRRLCQGVLNSDVSWSIWEFSGRPGNRARATYKRSVILTWRWHILVICHRSAVC